jgi:UDPglucose--hexose-1-phosphate uridylyltransferase
VSAIEFRREVKKARLLDPRRGFDEVEVESEVRFDPLTQATSRICHFSLKAAPPTDLDQILAASRSRCPFCPESIASLTPRYPDSLMPGGRLARGEAALFPNLFPYDDFSAVAVMSGEHYLPMAAIPERIVTDALGLAREFLARAFASVAAPREHYGIVTWNYMPPAGATQVHPHMQVVFTRHPGNALVRELDAEAAYRTRHGSNYCEDLVARERGGERWIGSSGSVLWFAPFAPSGVLGDCRAVFPGRSTIAELGEAGLADFASGLSRALRGFSKLGLWSFNLTLFPDHEGAGAQRHWLTARLLPRLYLNPGLHVPDVAYLQLLLEERFAMAYPEATAAALRESFAG